jgi:hypothetical protein
MGAMAIRGDEGVLDVARRVFDACDWLEVRNVKAPISRRDPDEPKRREKELLEVRFIRAMLKLFRAQAKAIRERLETRHPERKTVDVIIPTTVDEWLALEGDEEIWALIFRIYAEGTQGGVELFQMGGTIGMDYSLINVQAAEFARNYIYDQFKPGINATTTDALQRAVSTFVETPGMTIGDVMRMLPLNEQRATMAARTEITRAYAEGQRIAGEAMREKFPEVPVVKTWLTKRDERVCEICGPVHMETVLLSESFSNGLANPPAHPNCRCWTSVGPDIERAK